MLPWVGMYIVVASLICMIAIAADAIVAIRQWKLWFPNRFFTLNAATITLIAIAMKLPVDLSTDIVFTKGVSVFFLVTMFANFLPSLGLMDDKELLMNIVALAILVITIAVNMVIQMMFDLYNLSDFIVFLTFHILFSSLWPFSVALTISITRKKLEHRYNESQQLVSINQMNIFSYKELKNYVKKYWMMAETHNPQFVIACSSVSSAFGVTCLFLSFFVGINLQAFLSKHYHYDSYEPTDYKWSLKIIYTVQSIGVVVGSIAPVSRCITSIGHYSLSKKLSQNHLNVFRVEKHWIQRLQEWKYYHVHSYIPSRRLKIVFHYLKNTFLNFCIAFHIAVLVICKTICLFPQTFLILVSYVLKRVKKIESTSNSNVNSEIEEYAEYVVQIEEEAKLSKGILTTTLRSITKLLDAQKEPRDLMMLLEKSISFKGVVEFDNHDMVQPLYPDETHNCWSLAVITLTTIAIALPNIANVHFTGLLDGITEGLQIVRHIEDCLNADDELVNAIKSARRVWKEVEVHRTWLHVDLQKMACKRKTSKEILIWLGDEAEKIMKMFKSNKKPSIDQSPYKFILASSMYRTSKTILLQFNDENLYERISTIIADVLFACFTNLPRAIKMKCQHSAIEKRGDNIRIAAQLLSKSEKILKILEGRPLPNIDQDSMAYIDKWRALTIESHA
ncbi:hypothetical protein E3N88_33168 [Mikania micrantha]|uniref:DUF4220 domain-containing protein n=1 Tax=Mikania micrantha TaxID=192012 RepID=A0A5N6MD61_9ASTR|nr:hypothetical protein E3N88_33168 [Mikania micrantha]